MKDCEYKGLAFKELNWYERGDCDSLEEQTDEKDKTMCDYCQYSSNIQKERWENVD